MNERESEVLEKYPFRVERMSRVRGASLCETEDGLRLLRETDSTEKRLQWENQILLQFPQNHRIRVETYVENVDGAIRTESSDRRAYCVKRWPEGRECESGSREDILLGTETLGLLHRGLGGIGRQLESPVNIRDWREELERHNRELVRIRSYVRRQRHKSELELQILADFPYYYEQAERAAVLTGEADPEISLCHGEYTYHHLLFRGRSTAVVDFSHMGWGVPLSDLYLYLRKNMEKQNWRFPLGKEMLEIYERLCPMGEDGRRYLYARLTYPEKFWKQVNSYYNRRKSWIPVRNLEKLRTLEVQKEKKEQFLAQLAAFWGIS